MPLAVPGRLPVCTSMLLSPVFLVSLLAAGDDQVVARFEADKRKALIEAGQGHLELGMWCRNAGLVPQASAEFLRAVEVSHGEHPSAWKVLSTMRRFEDKFFKVRRQNPSKGLIDQYEARARKLDLDLERDTARIASWAHARGLKQQAYEAFRTLLMARSEPLQFD